MRSRSTSGRVVACLMKEMRFEYPFRGQVEAALHHGCSALPTAYSPSTTDTPGWA